MEGKGATTYTLRNKGKDRNISGSTVVRLQNNESVSTNTLDTLCKILDCKLSDIAEFIPDKDTMLQGAEKALSNLKKLEEEKLWNHLLFHNKDIKDEFSTRQTEILKEINHSFRQFCVFLFYSRLLSNEVIKSKVKSWTVSLPAQAASLFTHTENDKTVCTVVAFRDIGAKKNNDAEGILQYITQQYPASFHESMVMESGTFVKNIYDINNSYRTALLYSDDKTVNSSGVIFATLTADQSKARASIMKDINTYVDEMTLKFIFGELDIDESWDEYISTLKSLNIEEAISITQEAVDTFNEKEIPTEWLAK